jgi:DNA-binding Xre family transcriptional regulator
MYAIDGTKVKMLMLEKWGDIEQKRLAAAAGFSEQTMVRMLKGYGFTQVSLYGLCRALDVTPNDVLKVIPKGTSLVGAGG